MKKLLFGLMAIGFIAITFLIGGCSLGNSTPNYTEYAIQVDSIQHPDTITYGSTLTIKFYGEIGPSTCYSFSRFAGNFLGTMLNVQVLGSYANSQSCAASMQYLNGDTLAVNQLQPGNFVIHVLEPSPPDIYDTVFVTQPAARSH